MPFYRVHAYDDEHYATLVIRAEAPEQASSIAVQFVAIRGRCAASTMIRRAAPGSLADLALTCIRESLCENDATLPLRAFKCQSTSRTSLS